LALSNEALGILPIADASWNRFAIRTAALVRLRALQQLGRSSEMADWAKLVAQQRKTATVDSAMLWKAAAPLLPR